MSAWTKLAVWVKSITHDTRKKCLLLHVAGEYVFDVADALTEREPTYAIVKNKLKENVAPKRNVEYELFMFRQAAQENGENIDKYHARLRHLAELWIPRRGQENKKSNYAALYIVQSEG